MPMWDVKYVDDAQILERSAETVQKFLNISVPMASSRGLLLNASKCEHIAMHSENKLTLSDLRDLKYRCPKPYLLKIWESFLFLTPAVIMNLLANLCKLVLPAKLLQPVFQNRTFGSHDSYTITRVTG